MMRNNIARAVFCGFFLLNGMVGCGGLDTARREEAVLCGIFWPPRARTVCAIYCMHNV